jgi:uncharacterized membrane protein YqjE
MAGSRTGLLREARSIWSDLRGVAEDRVRLAALETRVAGESLARMVAAGVLAALLAVTAWLAIVGAIVLALIRAGMPAIGALLLAAAASIGGAVGLYFFIKGLSRNLTFPATVDALRRRDPEVAAPPEER